MPPLRPLSCRGVRCPRQWRYHRQVATLVQPASQRCRAHRARPARCHRHRLPSSRLPARSCSSSGTTVVRATGAGAAALRDIHPVETHLAPGLPGLEVLPPLRRQCAQGRPARRHTVRNRRGPLRTGGGGEFRLSTPSCSGILIAHRELRCRSDALNALRRPQRRVLVPSSRLHATLQNAASLEKRCRRTISARRQAAEFRRRVPASPRSDVLIHHR